MGGRSGSGGTSRRNLGFCGLLTLAVSLLAPGVSAAAEITVDGSCTLQDAITAANMDSAVGSCAAGSGTDTISLTVDVVLTEQLPEITQDLILDGQGFSVSRDPGAASFRVFSGDATNLTYRNLTVTGGVDGSGFGQAGGIWDRSTFLTLDNTTVAANEGNGVYTVANLTIVGSTISDNTGSGVAGVYAYMDIVNSTIANNASSGVVVDGDYTSLALTNSTVSGNDIGLGGGFVNYGYIDLVRSTIAGNRLGVNVYGSWDYSTTSTDSILGHNSQTNCAGGFYPPLDLGGNLSDDSSCGGSFGFLTGLDANLADNGGPTETHALSGGSSAVDAAGACGAATDQRGYSRHDGACDSGAFEYGGLPPTLGGALTGGQGNGTVRCNNRTAGQTVRFDLGSDQTFSCVDAGLDVSPGDLLRVTVRDAAGPTPMGGVAVGMSVSFVRCANRTSGQQVTISAPAGNVWDCEAAGLPSTPGDTLQHDIVGNAD